MHIVGDDWNDTPCSSLFGSLAMMQFRIEAIDIRVFFTRTQSIQKQIVEYDIKSKYPEEYSTVDKLGREKLVGRKSCFV